MDRDVGKTVPESPEDVWADSRVGRYTLRRIVGTGGMGVVFAAHDPELDREVAIKLVTASFDDEGPVREAQAMARLTHPNVVRVYEVLRLGARTAIVMELVDGEELRTWQTHEHRSWRDVLDAYVQASRGLAAAHRAGIVHRDFKPSNVLVDRDGVVRVSDFGIARRVSKEAPEVEVAGTPVYMPPEQHGHGEVDARTDQWSFACALYEALYGRRPFAASEGGDLAKAVASGEIEPEPTSSPVPRPIRAAIRRALSTDPEQRFATVDDFAAVLSATPRHRSYLFGAVAAIAILVSAIVLTRRSEAPACQDLDRPMHAAWTDAARARLRARLAAPGVALPATTIERALRDLDGYATSWATMRTRSCQDKQQGALSTEMLDSRTRCLDHRLAELSGLLDGLADADNATLRATSDAVSQLQPVAGCTTPDASAQQVSPTLQREIDEAENGLARANAAMSLAQYERALPFVDRAIATGEPARVPSLVARALVIRGECEDRLGRYEASLATYRLAATTASQARDHHVVADALARAFLVEGDHLGRRADALKARPYIELAIESAGQPDPVRAEWLHFLAILLYDDPTKVDEAARHERESLEIRRRTLTPNHMYIVDSMETLANIEAARNNFDESETLLTQVLDARIAARGPNDMLVSSAHNNLGVVQVRRGNLPAAIRYLEAAVEVANAAGRSNTAALFNLAISQFDLGRWRAATATFAKALEASEQLGPDSRAVASAATYLGAVLVASGEVERGRPLLARGLDVARRSGAASLGSSLVHNARLALADGDQRTARALYDEAMAIPATNEALRILAGAELSRVEIGCRSAMPMFTNAIGRSDPREFVRTIATVKLAECEVAAGDKVGARTRLEAELALLVTAEADEIVQARLRTALAKTR